MRRRSSAISRSSDPREASSDGPHLSRRSSTRPRADTDRRQPLTLKPLGGQRALLPCSENSPAMPGMYKHIEMIERPFSPARIKALFLDSQKLERGMSYDNLHSTTKTLPTCRLATWRGGSSDRADDGPLHGHGGVRDRHRLDRAVPQRFAIGRRCSRTGRGRAVDERLRPVFPAGQTNKSGVITATESTAKTYAKNFAGYNTAGGVRSLALNDADIEFGFTDASNNYTPAPTYAGFPNTVKVTMRLDSQANGSLKLFFAPLSASSRPACRPRRPPRSIPAP